MSAPRTPSKRSLSRVPSMGSSFAGCFGATAPISPQRAGGHGLLGGQACVNYRKLGFDEDEEEDTYSYEATLGEQYKKGMQYASEGEEQRTRERKLGSHWTMREKARMEVFHASETPKEEPCYASEQEDCKHFKERKGVLKLGKLWSMREKDSSCYAPETPKKQEDCHATEQEEAGVYVRERKGVMKLGKLWTMREKARRGVYNAAEEHEEEEEHGAAGEKIDESGRERSGEVQSGKHVRRRENEGVYAGSPRRESLSRKVREACVQVLESARRSSPHLSELFVGNQLLMQVTSSSSFNARRANKKNVAPSVGFVVAGDPPLSFESPPRSSSSSAF